MSKPDRLSALYPFLQSEKQDPARFEQELLDSTLKKSQDSLQVLQGFFSKNAQQVVRAAQAIAVVFRNHGRLLTMGNGGSSCDAAHIAVEFLHPVTTGRSSLPAINLVSDQAMMTAVGNDVGFDHIFVRQVIAHGKPEDGLIGASTSGNSENLLEAFMKAKDMGMATIGLTGGTGGLMAKATSIDHCLIVETDSIHRIQECHVLIYHILWDLVHTLLADERGPSSPIKGTP